MSQPSAAPGRFVTFEGVDGSGKSTQVALLADALTSQGLSVTRTREPGGAPGAEEIRRLILTGDPDRWSPETEILLFTAARRDHLEKTILPALSRGDTVICDRFADSTRIYQGATRGDLRALVDRIHDAVIGREPDLTIILDMDPEIALRRGLARDTDEARFEAMGLEVQRTVRDGFLSLARDFPDRCRVVDAGRAAEEIARDVLAVVNDTATR